MMELKPLPSYEFIVVENLMMLINLGVSMISWRRHFDAQVSICLIEEEEKEKEFEKISFSLEVKQCPYNGQKPLFSYRWASIYIKWVTWN